MKVQSTIVYFYNYGETVEIKLTDGAPMSGWNITGNIRTCCRPTLMANFKD